LIYEISVRPNFGDIHQPSFNPKCNQPVGLTEGRKAGGKWETKTAKEKHIPLPHITHFYNSHISNFITAKFTVYPYNTRTAVLSRLPLAKRQA